MFSGQAARKLTLGSGPGAAPVLRGLPLGIPSVPPIPTPASRSSNPLGAGLPRFPHVRVKKGMVLTEGDPTSPACLFVLLFAPSNRAALLPLCAPWLGIHVAVQGGLRSHGASVGRCFPEIQSAVGGNLGLLSLSKGGPTLGGGLRFPPNSPRRGWV